MIFEVLADGNYLTLTHKSEVYKLPRYFCRAIGLKPGRWEIIRSEDGILLQPKNDLFFCVGPAYRTLRTICYDKFLEITGIDVAANPGKYILKEVK